jgi:hypothetical protein
MLDQGPVVTVTFAVFNLRRNIGKGCFENRVLKKVFGIRQRKQQDTGQNCIMRNLYGLYSSVNII